MSKSRSLVLALSLSVGVGGMGTELPADVSEPAVASATTSADTLVLAEAPVRDGFDVVGSGWWQRAKAVAKCGWLGVAVGYYYGPSTGARWFADCYDAI